MNSDSENECLIEERSSDEEFSSSESESDDDCLDSARDRCQIDVTSPLPSHPKFPFTGNPGIKVCIGDSGDPFEYFNLFLDDEMFSFIVEETNRYAESFFENAELTPGSRALKWKNTNKEEMKRFIALLLLQGVVQKPVEQWFWSKRPILSTPFFGKVMDELCESESGYIWNSLIYTGKGTAFNENYNDYGLSTKSVLTLIHELKGKGYCLSTDNFYTSPELAELLIDSKTDICGTLRPNRKGLPVSFKSSTLKKEEIIAFQKGKMCVLKWKDKKPLHMLRTFHNADMMEVKAKKGDSVKLKPKAVVFYNNSMGGVDRSDQCLSYYPLSVARNQQRKYYKIFRHLLNQIVWNSFVIFKKNGRILNHIGFRMKLIERLIEEGGSDSSSRNFASPNISENVVRLVGRHFPSYVEIMNAKQKLADIVKFGHDSSFQSLDAANVMDYIQKGFELLGDESLKSTEERDYEEQEM
ncbi:piggyBac transposable element-derived protein 4 [Trichonephila clavipes]|uniref:PiggyBac transposable element-derived protein 4 n=1 Tax=Trichonephila clavipes TaxID=2585209 RepID=A0A8X6VGN7_TRICX|nr:piggyBac transposable element-derived protein 4 [Trichonephila clavipes]